MDACGICGGTNLCKIDTATVTLGGRRGDRIRIGAFPPGRNDSAWPDSGRDGPPGGPGPGWDSEEESSAGVRGVVGGWRRLLVAALAAVAWALAAATLPQP